MSQEDAPYRGIESSLPQAGQGSEARQTENDQEAQAPEGSLEALEPGSVVELSLELIHPDPNQPRTHIDDEALKDIIETVKSGGLLQPILVRPHPSEAGHFLIIVGHRRFRAHQLAGLPNIRALVRDLNDEEALKAALIENTQREDLDPFDEAATYERLHKAFKWSQVRIAREFGRDQAVVNELIKLAKLPQKVKDEYEQSKQPQKIKDEYQRFPISRSLLFLVARQKSLQEQLDLWEMIHHRQVRTVAQARAMLETTGKKGEEDEKKKVVKTMAQLLSAAKRLHNEDEFPADYYHENPHEYRKLVDLSAKLATLVENLRRQFGEPPTEAELSPRPRGRKPKADATPQTPVTQPMEPA